jgi:hypothetical protein
VTENESLHSGSRWEPVPGNGDPSRTAAPADETAAVPPGPEAPSGSGRRAALAGVGAGLFLIGGAGGFALGGSDAGTTTSSATPTTDDPGGDV